MRILVDTNIIISGGIFPESIVGKVLAHITRNHHLVLCQYSLDEMKSVCYKKFPLRIDSLNKFLRDLEYELVDIKSIDYRNYPKIRDVDDIPVLANAIEAKADLFVTGDKDFDDVIIKTPEIINPRKYIEKYM